MLDTSSMEGFIVMLAPSLHDVVRPILDSVPESLGIPELSIPGRAAGSPEKSNTETQLTRDAFFIRRRALETSAWKILIATLFFLQKKLMDDGEK